MPNTIQKANAIRDSLPKAAGEPGTNNNNIVSSEAPTPKVDIVLLNRLSPNLKAIKQT